MRHQLHKQNRHHDSVVWSDERKTHIRPCPPYSLIIIINWHKGIAALQRLGMSELWKDRLLSFLSHGQSRDFPSKKELLKGEHL